MKTTTCERCDGERECGSVHETWECIASIKRQRDEARAKLAEVVHCSNADCSHHSVVASVPCVFCRHKETKAKLAEVDAQVHSVCEQSASLETGVNATAAPASASEEPAFDAEARGWLTHILEDLYGDGDEEEADDLVDSLASRLQNAYERGRRSKR